jgi:hypothetical protein
MAKKTLPLGKDPALTDPSGINPKDVTGSEITIDPPAGNPDETVNLPGYEDVGGVEEDGIDPDPTISEIYPPTKGD